MPLVSTKDQLLMESCQQLMKKLTLRKQVNSPGHPSLTKNLKEQSKKKTRKTRLMRKDITSLLPKFGKEKGFKIGNISMVHLCLGCTKVRRRKMEISIITVNKNTLGTFTMVRDRVKANFCAQMDESTRVISSLATSRALIL